MLLPRSRVSCKTMSLLSTFRNVASADFRVGSIFSYGTGQTPTEPSNQQSSDELHQEELEKAAVEKRKQLAVANFMSEKIGREKSNLAQILQSHGVLVKGGHDEAHKLMDALIKWKEGS